ncbi:MAG: 4-alpha-glucanotransferase, partial [Flavitalea sp.]
VRRYNRDLRRAVEILENAFLKKPHEGNEELNKKIAHFYQRCMQFTGPLMAKGVEDTLMYSYNRFIAHNEVGDSPESFGISIEEFHLAMMGRQKNWPLSLNATSTHDTKRGEDVRTRLNVLTDIPDEWIAVVKEWQQINSGSKTNAKPDANDEYFIYQTLTGIFPPEADDTLKERISEYLKKALREAKVHSNWNNPDASYENAAIEFATGLLDPKSSFYKSFEKFQNTITDHGIINSLSQLLLKFTCPGVPDVYQGCELWDFTLVDPDNRRSVDYKKRIQWLDEINTKNELSVLCAERKKGKIKLWLTQQLFKLRRQYPSLFTVGEYIPLDVKGNYNSNIIAFGRKHGLSVVITVLPLHTAIISREQECLVNEIDWKDTKIILPEGSSNEWQDLVNDTSENYKHEILIAELFKELPFSILKGRQVDNERGAGILLHISSLPSAFGIGDLGPEAIAFAEFLHRSHQKYWQLLPLNPTEAGQGHSPYSSISSRAGNTLLISPQLLAADGLLQRKDLEEIILPQTGNTNYEEATRMKEIVFEKAWKKFNETKNEEQAFNKYAEQEKNWLDDFAIYAVLKQINNGKPWYEWKDEFKFREQKVIDKLLIEKHESIRKVKWLQFIFSKQWHQLKEYCNNLGIQFIGDLPFYVSYDSVDVWSNREIFELDEEGKSTGMAGVPPDAFSADGQLWGMPVFKWDVLKENNYAWWVDRLKKNMELFDSIRLDHFRAFSAYWKVPAGEATARNGEWITGPGSDFFHQLREQLGELPFVAEDLGEIDDPVYRLRDEFKLPGMKVLQFAFGGDMPRSIHIPHNYSENFIVYTGTHDNNTIRGWFTTEADEENRLALERYVGRPLSAAEIPIVMARMAYSSVAKIAILPLQDVLGLDHQSRMNIPASAENNWGWRLLPGQLTGIAERNLRKWTRMYNRE